MIFLVPLHVFFWHFLKNVNNNFDSSTSSQYLPKAHVQLYLLILLNVLIKRFQSYFYFTLPKLIYVCRTTLQFLLKAIFPLSLSLSLRRLMVLMVSLMWFSFLVILSLHSALVNYFPSCFPLLPFFHVEILRSVGLYRKKGEPLSTLYYGTISFASTL